MPTYEYRCPNCRLTLQDIRPFREADDFPLCPECTEARLDLDPDGLDGSDWPLMKRIPSSFAKPREFHEGLNPTTGKYTSSAQQHIDNLKRQSDEASERTGITHSFVPLDPAESASICGITDEGLDSTYREATKRGERETKLWL